MLARRNALLPNGPSQETLMNAKDLELLLWIEVVNSAHEDRIAEINRVNGRG